MVTSPWMKLTRATPWLVSFPASPEPGPGVGSGPGGAWAPAGITAKSTRIGIASQAALFALMGHLVECPTIKEGTQDAKSAPRNGLYIFIIQPLRTRHQALMGCRWPEFTKAVVFSHHFG